MRARYASWYLGLDYGVRGHPTALSTLRRVAEPEAEPVLEVVDMAMQVGASNAAIAREVGRTLALLDGEAVLGVDCTGPGEGLAQELRKVVGARVVEVRFTGGARVVRRGNLWSVPSNKIFETVYSLLSQGRLRVPRNHELTPRLVEEADMTEVVETERGNVRYECRAAGGHGDLLVSVGTAAVLHEVPHVLETKRRAEAGRRGSGRPTSGTTRPWSGAAGRRRIEQLREERERRWRDTADELWQPARWAGYEIG